VVADLLDTPLDGFDADAVEAAVDQVRGHLGWHLAPATPDGHPRRPRLGHPAAAVAARDRRGQRRRERHRLLDASTYGWSTNGVVERLRGCWTSRRRAIVVTFTHGYDACPPAVRQVVARIATGGFVAERLKARTDGPFQRIYDTTSPSGALDPYSERILDRYRLPTRS
jgi:hypothetical protein